MHFSRILVVAARGRLSACLERLESLPGLEIHFVYPESGRIIVVQETDSVDRRQEGLRRIQALPEVWLAELVYHRIEDGLAPDLAGAGSRGARPIRQTSSGRSE